MKNNVLTIFCIFLSLFFTINLFGQENDFKRFVGGNLGFELQGVSNSENKLISYSIAPTFGTFVSEKIVAGASIGYQGTYVKSDNFFGGIQEERASFVFINPFVRFRIPVGEKLGFYTELDLLLGGEFAKVGSGNTAIKADPVIRSGVHAGPGMDYRFSDRWFFNINWGILGVDTYKIIGNDGLGYRAGFNFDTSNLLLGINYRF